LDDIEHLDGDNRYQCSVCCELVAAQRSVQYVTSPAILTFHLTHFTADAKLVLIVSQIVSLISSQFSSFSTFFCSLLLLTVPYTYICIHKQTCRVCNIKNLRSFITVKARCSMKHQNSKNHMVACISLLGHGCNI